MLIIYVKMTCKYRILGRIGQVFTEVTTFHSRGLCAVSDET
jgi:hypothetical protein